MRRLLCCAVLFPSFASAAPLTVVEVGAPAINCVFDTSCAVTVSDSLTDFTLAGESGTGHVQSRTFAGAPGAPAAGLTGYDYRLDMTGVTAGTAKDCIIQLQVDFGPVATLGYKPGVPSELYVVTSGGLGTVGVASAGLTGSILTVKFAGNGVCPGATSHFFGLAAKGAPKSYRAGLKTVLIKPSIFIELRAPTH